MFWGNNRFLTSFEIWNFGDLEDFSEEHRTTIQDKQGTQGQPSRNKTKNPWSSSSLPSLSPQLGL